MLDTSGIQRHAADSQSGVPLAPTVALPQLPPDVDERLRARRRRYPRWRALALLSVYVLAAIHIAHWRLNGVTLAPLELNELMYTLELGIVTAGFAFMVLVILSAAIFGRFFCSWGCHVLALQDLCSWIMQRLRIRATPVRSRALSLVAPAALVYMFVWPQVRRLINGRPLPRLRMMDDSGGWASWITDDFWRNLPEPGVALATFLVCGFGVVWFLGTRSFCRYACPYGVLFGLMDRVAPGRIRVDPARCTACGICTGVCESHVRVHEEIAEHGCVVDSACLKDLDCIGACPEQALSFGWGRVHPLASLRPARLRVAWHYTWPEEFLMAGVMVGSVAIFRGLYGTIPFLLTLGIGVILALLSVVWLRVLTRANVRLNVFQLKRSGRVTRTGRAFFFLGLVLLGATAHSGIVRFHEVAADRALEREDPVAAIGHMRACERWGIALRPGHEARLAGALWATGARDDALARWRLATRRDPDDIESRMDLASALMSEHRFDEAEPVLRAITDMRERSRKDAVRYRWLRASAWDSLGAIAVRKGDLSAAKDALVAAVTEAPCAVPQRVHLAQVAVRLGDRELGAIHLAEASRLSPDNAELATHAGDLLLAVGDVPGAVDAFSRALSANPDAPGASSGLAEAERRVSLGSNPDPQIPSSQRVK